MSRGSVEYDEGIHNSAAADRMSGTESEREEFVDDWLAAWKKKIGTEYMMEPITESTDAQQIEMFAMLNNGAPLEYRAAVLDVIRAYWLPLAQRACEEHDFTPERCF